MHSYSVRDTVYFMHIMLSMHTYSRSTTLVVVIYIIIHTYIYIYIHRFFLYAFLSLPASIVASIFALPRALFANPPMVFFLTVTIRMFGRNVLGARAPDVKAGEGGDDDGKDIFSMIKRTAIGYLSSSFPNAARLMEILKDARQDIFVTFCGLFVGLALPAHLGKELGWDEL